ncbi:MAG TPA: phosphopantothenoylcysteine decarboxylase [Coleofasciculaceae cyanobacterium]
MDNWDLSPPSPSELGDREVLLDGMHLAGRRIALLVCGSIAAYRSPDIARALRRQGADVVAFVSKEARRYVTIDALEWSTNNPVVTRLTAAAEHLSDERPFAAYLVAPATYDTINKMRLGIADGVVTSTLASAIGRMESGRTALIVAPTMHGSMHNSLLTESLRSLRSIGARIIQPRRAYGKNNLPDPQVIVVHLCRALSRSPLRDIPILVTGGPTPVPLDAIRRITNRFTGQLGIEIAQELHLRGATVHLVHGAGTATPPDWLPHTIAPTYDAYRDRVLTLLGDRPYRFGIFSAAVADYQPAEVHPGKIPSGGEWKTIQLKPTEKVIDLVQSVAPNLGLISFKYQEGVSHEALLQIARSRLQKGHLAVVANRGNETGPNGEQVAYLVTGERSPLRMMNKPGIATGLADWLESAI